MSQSYTISEAQQGRTYNGKYGDMVVWKVRLENANAESADGMFELHKKPGNTPAPGDSIDVQRFDQGEFDGSPFVRIYLAKPPDAGGSRSGGSHSGGQRSDHVVGLTWASAPYERGAEHPRNEVRMIHTSALSAAVPYINQMLAFGLVEAPKDEDAYWTLVGHVAGRLTKSYEQPLSATEPPQQTLNGGGGEVPADTAGMVSAPTVPALGDDTIPFRSRSVPDRETRRRDLFIG